MAQLIDMSVEMCSGSTNRPIEKSDNCEDPKIPQNNSPLCIGRGIRSDYEESGASSGAQLDDSSGQSILCNSKVEGNFKELNLYVAPKKGDDGVICLSPSKLGEICLPVLKGKESLNEIESTVYEPLFNSQKNILINLPLGFDKTILVALAVLSLNLDPSKVVYLVPSLAVAYNVTRLLKKSFASLKVKVLCITDSSQSDLGYTPTCTSVFISTPEVWGRFTQKINDDTTGPIQMMILDNLNCIAETCGPALETIVARMSIQMDCDSPVRIVGFTMSLLNTNILPCYLDLAKVLKVEDKFTFLFSNQINLLPPDVTLITGNTDDSDTHNAMVTGQCIYHVEKAICNDKNIIVYVHNEEELIQTAEILKTATYEHLKEKLLLPPWAKGSILKTLINVNSSELYRELCTNGYIVLSSNATKKAQNYLISLFKRGITKILVTTPNFAPVFANQADIVFVKGTDIFNEEAGCLVDMGVCALTDLFGMATHLPSSKTRHSPGKVVIAVKDSKFEYYSKFLQNSFTVESKAFEVLPDLLNAEITQRGISDIAACQNWFRCTYLYQTTQNWSAKIHGEGSLEDQDYCLMLFALRNLEVAGMVRFLLKDNFVPTDIAYIAAHYYIPHGTVEYLINTTIIPGVSNIIDMLCHAPIFSVFSVEEGEYEELHDFAVQFSKWVPNEENSSAWKVSIIFQMHLLRHNISSPKIRLAKEAIVKRMSSVSKALFEVSLNKKNGILARSSLEVAYMVEKSIRDVPDITLGIDIWTHVISRTVAEVNVCLTPQFKWKEIIFGKCPLKFWIWIEDSKNNDISSCCAFVLSKKHVVSKDSVELSLTAAPQPTRYTVYVVSQKDLNINEVFSVNLENITLSNDEPEFTDLAEQMPLHVSALDNNALEKQYTFEHFSPELTQSFDSLYQGDHNVFFSSALYRNRLIAAELAIFRAICKFPGSKVVYLTPWDIEVKERILDWKVRFEELNWKVIKFSGKNTEDIDGFKLCELAVATIQHWKLACCSEEIQRFLEEGKVSLVIIDGLHVMNNVMESVIFKLILVQVRIVALSETNISSVKDIANFLGVSVNAQSEFYHFKCLSNNEPVPKVTILGFTQEQYDMRMKAMTLEVWKIIKYQLSSDQLVTILATSEKEVLATALTLKNLVKLHNAEFSTNSILVEEEEFNLEDQIVAECVRYRIGIIHSGMSKSDHSTVKTFCFQQKIQILILHIDIAHTVRLTNKLLIVKGTVSLNDTTENEVHIRVPELINKMYACSSGLSKIIILTSDKRRHLLESYFKNGLLVESNLVDVLPELLNNEIVSRNIVTTKDVEKNLSHTFLAHRLTSNPHCFHSQQITELAEKAIALLVETKCIILKEESGNIQPTPLGMLSAVYGLSPITMKELDSSLKSSMTNLSNMLLQVCSVHEFKQLSTKLQVHEELNRLEEKNRWQVKDKWLSPLVMKILFMLESHFSDGSCYTGTIGYEIDKKQVVCIAHRIMQVVVELCSKKCWLASTLQAQTLLQMIVTGNWGNDEAPIFSLPHIDCHNYMLLFPQGDTDPKSLRTVLALYNENKTGLVYALENSLSEEKINEIYKRLKEIPVLNVEIAISGIKRDELWLVKKKSSSSVIQARKPNMFSNKRYHLHVKLMRCDAMQNNSFTLITGYIRENRLVQIVTVKPGENEVILPFGMPEYEGEVTYTLFILADNFVGINETYDINYVLTNRRERAKKT